MNECDECMNDFFQIRTIFICLSNILVNFKKLIPGKLSYLLRFITYLQISANMMTVLNRAGIIVKFWQTKVIMVVGIF